MGMPRASAMSNRRFATDRASYGGLAVNFIIAGERHRGAGES